MADAQVISLHERSKYRDESEVVLVCAALDDHQAHVELHYRFQQREGSNQLQLPFDASRPV